MQVFLWKCFQMYYKLFNRGIFVYTTEYIRKLLTVKSKTWNRTYLEIIYLLTWMKALIFLKMTLIKMLLKMVTFLLLENKDKQSGYISVVKIPPVISIPLMQNVCYTIIDCTTNSVLWHNCQVHRNCIVSSWVYCTKLDFNICFKEERKLILRQDISLTGTR